MYRFAPVLFSSSVSIYSLKQAHLIKIYIQPTETEVGEIGVQVLQEWQTIAQFMPKENPAVHTRTAACGGDTSVSEVGDLD